MQNVVLVAVIRANDLWRKPSEPVRSGIGPQPFQKSIYVQSMDIQTIGREPTVALQKREPFIEHP